MNEDMNQLALLTKTLYVSIIVPKDHLGQKSSFKAKTFCLQAADKKNKKTPKQIRRL